MNKEKFWQSEKFWKYASIIVAVIMILALFALSANAADYGDTKDFSAPKKFEYYRIETDDDIYYCESFAVDLGNGDLMMKGVFIEGSEKEDSEYIIIPKKIVISIQKKKAETKEKVVEDKGSGGCFIQTAGE